MFRFEERLNIRPSWNVAPTHVMPIVRSKKDGNGRELVNARWGLIPHWSKDEKIGYRTINARAETVAEKPTFRTAYKKHRALVPATGFFEWQERGKDKQPYLIQLRDGELFAFAGLWSRWQNPEGETITSYTIITTEPNELCAPIHQRMPVILAPEDHDRWFDLSVDSSDLLKPYPANAMEVYEVDKRVGNVGNNDAALIERLH